MLRTKTFKDYRTADVTPPIEIRAPWRVLTVIALENYQLQVEFVDGQSGIIDMKDFIHSPRSGVFASLVDPKVFSQATIAYGAVTWPNGLDLAPDAMHNEISTNGSWHIT